MRDRSCVSCCHGRPRARAHRGTPSEVPTSDMQSHANAVPTQPWSPTRGLIAAPHGPAKGCITSLQPADMKLFCGQLADPRQRRSNGLEPIRRPLKRRRLSRSGRARPAHVVAQVEATQPSRETQPAAPARRGPAARWCPAARRAAAPPRAACRQAGPRAAPASRPCRPPPAACAAAP